MSAGAGGDRVICKKCRESRRYAPGAVYCVKYGMIVRETHSCGAREDKGGINAGAEPQAETKKRSGNHEEKHGMVDR